MSNRTAMKSATRHRLDGYAMRLERLHGAMGATPNPAALGFGNIFIPDKSEIEAFNRSTRSASFNSEFAACLAAFNATRGGTPAFAAFNAAFNADFATADSPRSPLQSFAIVAAENDNLVPQTNFLAPDVNTNSASGIFSYTDRSSGIQTLQSIENLERAINAPPTLVDGKGTQAFAECVPYALASEVDWARYEDPEQEMQNRITEITDLIQLFRFQMAFGALSAIAANTAKTWDTTAGKDPDQDVLTLVIAAATGSGFRPTRAMYGETAGSKRKLAHRAQNTAGGFASANASEEDIARFLGIGGVMFSNALARDQDGTIAGIIANLMLVFRTFPNASLRDSSILKAFFALDHGQRYYTQIRQVSEFVWRVCVSYKERMLITGPVAGDPVRQYTIS